MSLDVDRSMTDTDTGTDIGRTSYTIAPNHEHCPGLGPVFRTLHGRRIVCLSVTVRITTEGTPLLHDADEPVRSRLQTLSGGAGVMNLTVGKIIYAKLKGWCRIFGTTNS